MNKNKNLKGSLSENRSKNTLKINSQLLNLLWDDSKYKRIAYDKATQKEIKNLVLLHKLDELLADNQILNQIIDEISKPRLEEEKIEWIKNLEKISNNFLKEFKLSKKSFQTKLSFPNYYVNRIQDAYIELYKTKLQAISEIMITLDPTIEKKDSNLLTDDQKTIALYVLMLNILRE